MSTSTETRVKTRGVEPKQTAWPQLPWYAQVALLAAICSAAYNARLNAVRVYGVVIHEFDPWFNFRATQYLVDNGPRAFLTWFDDQSWYPIGRPVGTTIYPGMMFTSAYIYHALQFFGLSHITLTDVCVYIPAFFACFTCLFVFLLTKEVSKSPNASVAAAALMSIVPAHMMRSVAGAYDNESIAVMAIVSTFYLWVRSLRDEKSWPIAIAAAVSYVYMVSLWGAYTFVINMIGLHGLALILIGRFSEHLHKAYTIFYIIGTLGAIQFPIVGWQPLQSMEQQMPLGVFFMMQLWAFLEHYRSKMTAERFVAFRQQVFAGVAAGGFVVLLFLMQAGYASPFSNRVRSLFVPHTKTGNPLVDSVAEHQQTPNQHYYTYFHIITILGPIGFATLWFKRTDARVFGIIYTLAAAYFSKKMVRLVLLLSPAASMTGGIGAVFLADWILTQLSTVEFFNNKPVVEVERPAEEIAAKTKSTKSKETAIKKGQGSRKKQAAQGIALKLVAAALILGLAYGLMDFWNHSHMMAEHLSEPQLMMRGRTKDGKTVMIDDYRQSYWWLRDNTPEDSRVLSWWDYGYQINGIANRTTLADGNTWNMEHIALIAKAMCAPEEEGHKITRLLADYVLVWTSRFAGIHGDDLQKMPHMANIASTVYPEISMREYFAETADGQPSEKLRNSLLFQLTYYGKSPAIQELKYYKEVYTSPNQMVRIYKVLQKAKRRDRESLKKLLKSQKGKH